MPNLPDATNAAIEAKAKNWILHAGTRIKQFAKAKKNQIAASSSEDSAVE